MTAPKLTEAQRRALVELAADPHGLGVINQRPAHRLRVMGFIQLESELGAGRQRHAKVYRITDAGRAALKDGAR